MKSKIAIVISREYLTRVKKTSFLLLTVLMPFLMAALVAVPIALGMVKDDKVQNIIVIDKTHRYAPRFASTERFTFRMEPAMKEQFKSKDSEVEAVVVITDDLSAHPDAATIYSRDEVQLELRQTVESILEEQIRADKLAAYNVPQLDTIIEDVQKGFSVQTVKWSDDGGETISSSDMAMGIGFLFTFLIYMFVMSYGGMVMSGVMEEKTNRIIEVMVSSVKPFQLMMGKIIGVMLVGLTQMLIWGVMLGVILGVAGYFLGEGTAADAALQATNMSGSMPTSVPLEVPQNEVWQMISGLPYVEIGVMFILCFLGGYLLYASIFAACGAAVNNQEDSSQFMMPIIILMIFGLYAAMGSVENTNGPLAFWASLFPFTSPIVMMIRIPLGVPLWQEVLCITILFVTAITFVWIGARIYRVGILMYGKKPSFLEIWKWLRYQ